jgi:hypothetical protein
MTFDETAKEIRRSPRIVACIHLDMQPLQPLAATTAVINLHGALILAAGPWASGTRFKIRNRKNNRSIRARVVWTGPLDEAGLQRLGVEFEEPESDFWGDDYSLRSR